MKLLVAALGGSLLLNAAILATFVSKPTLAPPAVRGYFSAGGSKSAAGTSAAKSTSRSSAAAPSQLWNTLQSGDLSTLVARLRAAGFSPALIRAIVSAQIEARFADQRAAIARVVLDVPYWKPDATSSLNNPKYVEEMNQLSRERAKLLRQVLGDQALADGSANTAQTQRYGSIPRHKIELIDRVAEDYAEMTSQVRAAMQGITLPDDRDKLALLEREKRADLAAILSPAELEEYEMRNSTVTSRLRAAMTYMDATEDEFRTIYRLQLPFMDILYPTGPNVLADTFTQQRDTQAKLAKQIKAVLGDQRYAEYARASTSEFQQLSRIAQRDNIGREAVLRAYSLRDSVTTESNRIYSDATLNLDQKRAALATLAQDARSQIMGALGPAAGNDYIDTARWLSYIEQGRVVTISGDNSMSIRSLPSQTPPPPPPAPRN